MRLTRDYYEILGITPEATPGEIKKSYRSLVRKYHPDVHPDKKLAERAFVQISEAYRTLSDPDKKRAYDRERATRTDARPGPGVSEVFTSRSGSTTTSARPKPNVTKFINDAEFAFIRGRLGEAEALCRRALQQDRTCARAYTILGDIYHAHGNKDKAIENYSYAVQFDPHRMDVQAKLERLLGGAPRRVRSARHGSVREPVPPGARLGSIATGMMFFLVFFWLMGLQNHFSAIVPRRKSSLMAASTSTYTSTMVNAVTRLFDTVSCKLAISRYTASASQKKMADRPTSSNPMGAARRLDVPLLMD